MIIANIQLRAKPSTVFIWECLILLRGFGSYLPPVLSPSLPLPPSLPLSFFPSFHLFFSSFGKVCLSLHSPGYPGIHYIDQTGLKLTDISLPIPPQSAGMNYVLLCLAQTLAASHSCILQ